MKKIAALFTTGTLLSLIMPLPAFAAGTFLNPCPGENDPNNPLCAAGNQVASSGIGGVLGNVINFIFVIAVILALGFLIYGGIRWITSGGDKGGVETARNTIIAAIIGLIVVVLAYFILNFILVFLGNKNGIKDVSIPLITGGSTSGNSGTTTPAIVSTASPTGKYCDLNGDGQYNDGEQTNDDVCTH